MKKFNCVVGRCNGKLMNFYKTYFYNEIVKQLNMKDSFINSSLNRFYMVDDVHDVIDSVLGVEGENNE